MKLTSSPTLQTPQNGMSVNPSDLTQREIALRAVLEIRGFYGLEFTIGLLKSLQYQQETFQNWSECMIFPKMYTSTVCERGSSAE